MKIIHITDLHAGFKSKKLGLDLDRNLNILLKELQNKYAASEKDYILVITGDLVDCASEESYENAYKNFIKPIKQSFKSVVITPGNHDYGNGKEDDPDFVAKFKEKFLGDPNLSYPFPVTFGNICFIVTDSTAGALNDKTSRGKLGKTQRDGILGILETKSYNKMKKVLCIHHHAAPIGEESFKGIKDHKELRKVIQGKVDAVLFGHDHLPVAPTIWDVPIWSNPGSSTQKTLNLNVIKIPIGLGGYNIIDLDKGASNFINMKYNV